MIKFKRHKNCIFCDEVSLRLKEMVVAHSSETLPESAAEEKHALVENGRVYAGQQAMNNFLTELSAVMDDWQKFQSDSCYIGEGQKIC